MALSGDRLIKDVSQVVQEVVQYLATQPKARVKLNLELDIEVPNGVPEEIVRIVTENAGALGFEAFGFEGE